MKTKGGGQNNEGKEGDKIIFKIMNPENNKP